MSSRIRLFIAIIILSGRVIAQTEADQAVEQVIESITEDGDEDYDYSELNERLNFYHHNPINVNTADANQLQELGLLSPLQINALIRYRETNGSFIDLLELQSVDGFDVGTIEKLLPFIVIGPINPLSNISGKVLINKGIHDLILRYGQVVEKQEGFLIPNSSTKSHYLGSPQRFFLRYRYSFGRHVFASLNMEKDAGEKFFSGSKSSGLDFSSASIFLKDIGKLRKIVLGDYAVQFGQGLALWTGVGFGKGAAVASIAKPDIGLRAYSSANEVLFFRGLAATIAYKKFSITPFFSYRKLDASFNSPDSSGRREVSSLSQTGFHRTSSEIKNEKSLGQSILGVVLQYNRRNFDAGITAYRTRFNHPFEHGKDLYNKYEFSGNELLNTGVYYHRNWRNMFLFGEAAHSFNSGFAYLNGLMASLSPQVSVVLMQRNYQKDYHSFYSESVSEGSKPVNEKGFYSGLIISPDKRTELTFYADIFSFPWLRFRTDAPSGGFEVLSQFTYSIRKKLKAILRYKFEEKEENDDSKSIVSSLVTIRKQNYRAELSYIIGDNFQLKNRLEITQYRKGEDKPEWGFLILQDMVYNPIQSPLSGNIRFSIFETSGYNSRIYVYENDVLYSYSVPAFQNRGLRFYVNARYSLKRGIDLWLKYAATKYTNVDEIGSGLDKINGSVKSDVKLQLRLQF